uniref:Proprotein convertase subtilisin/kexin type 9-like n=1 Tax=Saccoglossus kowalevskii TaxID=10224 RepID=A0ABM0MIW0_SACKO|nr:PREDICTED: proprotein convertase subtilisin/kexin type 9-like [Saccoglossus kowalevskii]
MGNMNTLYFVLCVVFVADLSIFSTAQVCSIDCHTRVGQVSDTDINSVSEIECEEGELMTGCSSYSQMSSERSGDHMKPIGDGKRSCVAMNGRNGTGTRAYARCCKWPGMECEYFQGNRSSSPDDGGSIAFCPDKINCLDTYATGCSVRSPWKGLTGTKPIMPDRCIGYNELVNKGKI